MISAILVLGLILRLINLSQSLWLDEAIEILAVKNNGFVNLVTKYAIGDFHPPLYHVILKVWDSLFGFSEISSRFPSVIFSLATCYFVYLIGKKIFSKKTGLLAAFFLAINPLAVYYSQETRMYSLAALAVTAAVYFFLDKKWVWYFFFFAVALYTDYLPWLLLPVFLFFTRKNKKLLLAHGFLFLIQIPWVPILVSQLSTGMSVAIQNPGWRQTVGGFDPKAIPVTMVKFIFGRISLGDKLLYALTVTPIAAIFGYFLVQNRQKLLWLWLIIPLILGFALSLFIPIFSYFRFLFILPAFSLLLAGGVLKPKFKVAGIIFVCLVSLFSLLIFNSNQKFQRENWRGAVKFFQSDPGLVLMPNVAQAAPISYYDPNQVVQDKNSLSVTNYRTVYLLRYVQEIFDPHDFERTTLENAGFQKGQEKDFNGVIVWKYQR